MGLDSNDHSRSNADLLEVATKSNLCLRFLAMSGSFGNLAPGPTWQGHVPLA